MSANLSMYACRTPTGVSTANVYGVYTRNVTVCNGIYVAGGQGRVYISNEWAKRPERKDGLLRTLARKATAAKRGPSCSLAAGETAIWAAR